MLNVETKVHFKSFMMREIKIFFLSLLLLLLVYLRFYIYVKKLILTMRKVSKRDKNCWPDSWLDKQSSISGKKLSDEVEQNENDVEVTRDFSARLWWTAEIMKFIWFNLITELKSRTIRLNYYIITLILKYAKRISENFFKNII